MGILEILTIVFVVLKLIGTIDWSWWQVFIPMYIAVVLYASVITLQIVLWRRGMKSFNKFEKRFWDD